MNDPAKSLYKTFPDAVDCSLVSDGTMRNIFLAGILPWENNQYYYYQYQIQHRLTMGFKKEKLDKTECTDNKLCGGCFEKSLDE